MLHISVLIQKPKILNNIVVLNYLAVQKCPHSSIAIAGEMDSENLRNRSPDLHRVRGANADHRLHH